MSCNTLILHVLNKNWGLGSYKVVLTRGKVKKVQISGFFGRLSIIMYLPVVNLGSIYEPNRFNLRGDPASTTELPPPCHINPKSGGVIPTLTAILPRDIPLIFPWYNGSLFYHL